MGWNAQTSNSITFSINWKDEVGDRVVDEFMNDLKKEAEEFIARKIQARFKQQITDDRVTFMCGDFDSYGGFF